MINIGLENEMQIISEIDRRRIKKMTPCIQKMLYKMYPNISQFRMFRAEKCDTYDKADIKINVEGDIKFLSVKCNSAKCVHSCYIKPFILFLREYGISKETQKTILKFHYGDGTLDGTGKVRLDYNEIMAQMKTEIYKANKELNSNKKLVKAFVKMCLFEGMYPEAQQAEYIYHGNIEHGFCCSEKEVLNFLHIKTFSYIKNIHIGPIIIHPYARYTDFSDKNPNKRHMIQCEWHNLARDLEYIANGFKY